MKLALLFLLVGCATSHSGPSYYDRCPSIMWEYRFDVGQGSEDALMEDSGRRNCLRFLGPEACLLRMEKLSSVDYKATCQVSRTIILKGN